MRRFARVYCDLKFMANAPEPGAWAAGCGLLRGELGCAGSAARRAACDAQTALSKCVLTPRGRTICVSHAVHTELCAACREANCPRRVNRVWRTISNPLRVELPAPCNVVQTVRAESELSRQGGSHTRCANRACRAIRNRREANCQRCANSACRKCVGIAGSNYLRRTC